MSILFLYLRVMPTGQRKSRMSTYAVMAVIVGAIISLELSYIFACKPFSHRWNNAGGSSATCIDVTLHGVINEIINIVTDILIIILPIPMIWSLHLSTRKKVGVILVFATGLLVVAVAAARIAIVEDLLNGDPNVSFKQWEYNITGVIQLYVALICCCLPSLKAFSKRYFPSLHGPNTTFNSKTSGPESKLSNKSSRGRSQVDTIDEIMLENGTRSPDGTYIELKETRDRDETYIMGSGSGLHGHNASSERIVEPWRGKGVANMVSVVGGGGGRNERMDNGRM
ncbi:MAG: hypothetical protein M1812_001444 [Candelaria pacifica]|nr:MAG: hypothetical protein M1812_001444 [Candelaria pacifica]